MKIADIIANSRVASAIEKLEQGQDVDISRVLALQSLDVARIGEIYAAEILEREDIADGQFAERVGSEQGSALWGLPGAPKVAGELVP